MPLSETDKTLFVLLSLNIVILVLHIGHNCDDIFYFFQLTIIAHSLVIGNFLLSILLHERKSAPEIKRILSRLHLMTLSL